MKITGAAYCFTDHINTDEIIPGRYLSLTSPDQLAYHAFADTHQEFREQITKTGIIVAGDNFGCGSSREQAAICLKQAGVQAIIAHSFARIFFRNAINVGIPVIETAEAKQRIKDGDELRINMKTGIIENLTTNKTFIFHSLPKWMIDMIEYGGYIRWSQKNKIEY